MSETRQTPDFGEEEEGLLLRLRPGWVLLFLGLLALVLRLFHYAGRSLWTDEFSTYWVATAPTWRECALRAAETQGMSPFYFFLERLVLAVLPHAEWSLRGLSLLASVAALWAVHRLALELFNDEQTGLVAALILALHEVHIYYAQEARPYALAMLCALLSQLWFLRWLRGGGRLDRLRYLLASVCLLFLHSLFLPLVLVQNLWYFYLRREGGAGERLPAVTDWWRSQAVIGAALLVQAVQVAAMMGEGSAWSWLPPMTWVGLSSQVAAMLDWQVFAIIGVFFLVFRLTERLPIRESLRRRRHEAVLLGLWLGVPIVSVYAISLLAGISLLDDRYLMLSLLAFQILLARFLCSFRSSVMRTTLPGAYVVLYLGLVLIPNFSRAGHFARPLMRQYDWRGAMAFLAENHVPGDTVLLRSGEIKENWVPTTRNPRIVDYVRAPFHSFYWPGPLPEIVTLPYTLEPRFDAYFDQVFAAAAVRPRTWIIGVDPPNTNYPLANLLPFLEQSFGVVRLYEADYGGVYLALLAGGPPPGPGEASDGVAPQEDEDGDGEAGDGEGLILRL